MKVFLYLLGLPFIILAIRAYNAPVTQPGLREMALMVGIGPREPRAAVTVAAGILALLAGATTE